jgi:arabinofuranan 3-O-arabinosyltransferase
MDDVGLTRRERTAMGVSSVAIAVLVLLQAPGRIVPETKLDVLLDPVAYLGRSLTPWDPSAAFGRVQNQAVGYLFPMGAFTSAGHALAVPPWIVQRLWISLVVIASLWGAHRVARAVGVGSAGGRVVAAWAYALAPATMGVTAFQSAGQLPYALAPWVLVPLLTAREGASPRRVAAWSALWVAAMGGVNGASAFAVLPLVAVWFTTRAPGRDRRRLLGWWIGAVVAATLWWLIPLAVSVRYGLRFTDFTEQSSLTTWTESGTEILRGTGNWLAFVQTQSGPWLPGGWVLSADRLAIAASTLVAAGGLWGLGRRDAPGRSWLLPSFVLAAVALGIGYAGRWGGPFDGIVQSLLDGPLVPFRNVHKFSAVARLPLAIGFGHLVSVVSTAARARRIDVDSTDSPTAIGEPIAIASTDSTGTAGSAGATDSTDSAAAIDAPAAIDSTDSSEAMVPTGATPAAVGAAGSGSAPHARTRARRIDVDSTRTGERHRTRSWVDVAAPALALVLIGLAIAPAARGKLTAPGSFVEVPAEWRDAVTWLDERDADGHTLVLPGSAFAEYRWGRPLDEPISSVGGSGWAVRDLIPLGGNGSTRLLDAVDTALQTESLPPGFTSALQRAGVHYLLVRNDLDLGRTFGPSPASVRRLLGTDPQVELVASFGPAQDDSGGDNRISSRPGTAAAQTFQALDVYEVPDPVDRATAYPAAEAAVTSGGPEALLDLEPSLTDGRAVVLSVDAGAEDLPDPVRVATDTARRRDVRFGSIRNNATYTLNPEEKSPFSGGTPVDRWPAGSPTGLTSARVDGAAAITDRRLPDESLRPEQQPYAAFDRNPATAWGPPKARVGEWVQVELDEPTDVGAVTVRIPETSGKRIGAVRVVTDQGSVRGVVGSDGSVTVTTPKGTTRSVRVVIDDLVGTRSVARVGISEIEIEGIEIHRPLVVPSPGGDGADVVSLARDRFDRFSLIRKDEQGELDREFAWGGAAQVTVRGTATAAAGEALDALIAAAPTEAPSRPIAVTASSHLHDQPAFAPSAAVDGNPATAWVSGTQADAPTFTLRWDRPVPVDTIAITPVDGIGRPIERVTVTAGGTSYDRTIRDGQLAIPATITDSLTLSFLDDPADAADPYQVAVAEISIPALLGRTAVIPDSGARVSLGCGDGPPVSVDGTAIDTKATTTVGALIDGAPIAWESCSPVDLDRGTHRVTATRGALLASSLVVEPVGGIAPPPAARSVEVGAWGATHRTVAIGAGDAAILATTENSNDGWEATLDGTTLTPIQVDGWRQGWRVPAGSAGTIELRYRPATTQRIGLALGLVALLVLIGSALLAPRGRGATPTWSPPDERPWPAPAAWGLAVLAGVTLGGPLVLVAVPLARVPRRSRWLPVIAAGAALLAGSIAFVWAGADVGDTTGTFSGPAQAFAVTAIVAVALALVPERAVDGSSAHSSGAPG